MIDWLVQTLLFAGGVVAGWFVPHDELAYVIIQFAVILLIILAFSVALIYVPILLRRAKNTPREPE